MASARAIPRPWPGCAGYWTFSLRGTGRGAGAVADLRVEIAGRPVIDGEVDLAVLLLELLRRLGESELQVGGGGDRSVYAARSGCPQAEQSKREDDRRAAAKRMAGIVARQW